MKGEYDEFQSGLSESDATIDESMNLLLIITDHPWFFMNDEPQLIVHDPGSLK